MDAANVVNLINHYRHDLLNQLQVIKGYIQLGYLEKVDDSMDEMFEYFNEERKLLSLNIPNVFLWCLTFSQKYTNFKLTYDVDVANKNLEHKDFLIAEKLEQIMKLVKENSSNDILHQIDIEFKDSIDACLIAVYVDNGLENKNTEIKVRINQLELEDIDISITNSEQIYKFQVSYS